jgi:hypothetical protein
LETGFGDLSIQGFFDDSIRRFETIHSWLNAAIVGYRYPMVGVVMGVGYAS